MESPETSDPGEAIMPFGQYRGTPLKKIPRNYLEWAADIDPEKRPIVKSIRLYLAATKAVPEPRKDCMTPPLKSRKIGNIPRFFMAPIRSWNRRNCKD